MQREAQPSLLDRDTFELPPLTYLAEPKKVAANAVSTDALEQNATLLEGVLEDFGVRGEISQVRPGLPVRQRAPLSQCVAKMA